MKEKRSAAGTGRAARVTGQAGKADAQTEQLKKITKKLGNAQVQHVLGRNDKARDAIYQFILHRLQKMHQIQAREKAAMKKQRVWFDEVAHKKAGFGLPDPTRWKEAAQGYKQAAEGIARGNLGQAVDRLDKAIEAERKAMQELPKEVPLDHTETGAVERPGQAMEVGPGEGCNPREVTEALHLAEDIERVSEKSKAEGVFRPRLHWWDAPEVEEGADDKKPEGRKKPGRRSPLGGVEEAASTKEAAADEKEEKDEDSAKEKAPEVVVPAPAVSFAPGATPAPPVRQVRTRVKKP